MHILNITLTHQRRHISNTEYLSNLRIYDDQVSILRSRPLLLWSLVYSHEYIHITGLVKYVTPIYFLQVTKPQFSQMDSDENRTEKKLI